MASLHLRLYFGTVLISDYDQITQKFPAVILNAAVSVPFTSNSEMFLKMCLYLQTFQKLNTMLNKKSTMNFRHRSQTVRYTEYVIVNRFFPDTLLGNEASDLITKRITWEKTLISGNHCWGMHSMLINPSVIHHHRARDDFRMWISLDLFLINTEMKNACGFNKTA